MLLVQLATSGAAVSPLPPLDMQWVGGSSCTPSLAWPALDPGGLH